MDDLRHDEPGSDRDEHPLAYLGKTPWEKLVDFLKKWKFILSLILIFGIGLPLLIFEVLKGVPTLDQLENPHPELATRIISADGEPLDQFYIKNRTTVKLREVPKPMIDALIATEDREFYDHWGMNIWRTFKAVWTDVVTLSPKQGASTITQQLARNLYLSQEKTPLRKLREAISAIQIERTHTKNEILEMYLNVCYMGRGTYGVAVASQVYFGKDVSKLTPAQCAFLIGVLKGPENYDPDDNYDRAVARRNTVIDNMVETGALDKEKAQKYKQEKIKVMPARTYLGIAPHFVEMIRQQLSKMPELAGYDLYRDGLVVYTTLNAQMQRAANRAVDEHIAEYQKNVVDKRWNWKSHRELLDSLVAHSARNSPEVKNTEDEKERAKLEHSLRVDPDFIDSVKTAVIRLQAGFVCLDQRSGQILAMVGSSNYREHRYGLNHATQIIRQPGSAFKPFVYASCFEKGYTPESIVSNEPIEMPDGTGKIWKPSNFAGEQTGGQEPIRTAIQWSTNLCAVHAILDMTNVSDVVKMAKRMGIKSNIPAVPSIALGSAEVVPIELASAYSTFANDGVRATPYAILSVEDRNGKIIFKAKPEFDYVFEPKIAQMMTTCLKSVVDGGTASSGVRRFFSYPAAGKTGTTQNYADAWFCGYTPHYTACAWVGFDDKRITFTSSDGQGGRAAAPIWGRFMKYSYEVLKPKIEYFNTNWNGVVPIDSTKKDSTGVMVGPQLPQNMTPGVPRSNPNPTPQAPPPNTPPVQNPIEPKKNN
ncbi:MAG TPA: PBP1A family penicillin-binding protein [Candidatus Kapabacteria bacterium]|nr:PBP1A family penicillin-binding protein [Candidatus Kapabacteria bacterium]